MKKVIQLIILILILVSIPLISNADIGMPGVLEYDVKVINESGAKLKAYDNKEITVPYGTILKVNCELNINGELCAWVKYNNSQYEAKMADLGLVSEEADISGLEEVNIKMYVYDEGAYLYKGPSKTYSKVDDNFQLPVGETVNIKYEDDMFGYVEYGGKKGWVYTYQMKFNSPYNEDSALVYFPEDENTKICTLKETECYTSPRQIGDDMGNPLREKADFTIPAYTDLKYKYVYNIGHSRLVCVDYNGKECWIGQYYNYDVAYNCENRDISAYTAKDLTIYKNAVYNESEALGTIPKNTLFTPKYVYADEHGVEICCYVTFNGVSGWIGQSTSNSDYDTKILLNSESYMSNDIYVYEHQSLSELPIYDAIDGNLTGNVIPTGTVLTQKFYYSNYPDTWYYLCNDQYQGWIKSGKQTTKVSNRPEHLEFPDDKETATNTNDNASELDLEDSDENNQPSGISSIKTVIVGCIIVTFIIAIIAIILVKKVNKNKNNKNAEKQ